ncbi:hypothetical protein BCR44DRAFT_1423006, partial [Catenaria anguillulae PL171]
MRARKEDLEQVPGFWHPPCRVAAEAQVGCKEKSWSVIVRDVAGRYTTILANPGLLYISLDCPNPSTAGLQTRYGPVFNEMHLRDVKFAKAFPVATLLKLGKALPIIKAELASAMPVGRRDRASKVWVVAAFAGDGLVAKGLGRTFASALSASFTHLAFHLMRKHVEGDIGKKIKLFEPAVHAFANDHVLSVCTTIFGTMCKNPPIAKQPGTTARTEPPAARTQAKAASREAKKRGSRNVECRQSPSSSHDAGQATERDRDQLAVSRRDSGPSWGWRAARARSGRGRAVVCLGIVWAARMD